VNTVSEAMLLAWRCLLCTSHRKSGDKYSDETTTSYGRVRESKHTFVCSQEEVGDTALVE